MQRRLFGTDGIRGVANQEPMTVELGVRLGRAVAYLFRNGSGRRPQFLIGKDTRLSGYIFENALSAGICSMGADVLLVGPMPTPGIAFLTQDMRADAGVVISASHNPYQDNGIKIFGPEGYKLPDQTEAQLEQLVLEGGEVDRWRPSSDALGKAHRIGDADGRYVLFCKQTFPKELDLDGVRIVLDCANGASYRVSPLVFRELGAEVFPIGTEPNGTNINEGCGSLHPGRMAAEVRGRKAQIGIALDGDADRAVFVDERGEIVDGDRILAILARQLLAEGKLAGKTLVATVMSNLSLDRFMKEQGGSLVRAPVGDRYVLEAMQQGGYNLGGEQSGHVIFLDHTTTGDGTICALQLLAVMKRSGKTLGQLADLMPLYPQRRSDLRVTRRVPLEENSALQAALRKAEKEVGSEGRILARYSGTEPLLRLLAEGPDAAALDRALQGLSEAVRAELA